MPDTKEQNINASSALSGSRTAMVKNVSGSKTIRVAIGRPVRHPLYGKFISKRTLLCVHDPKEEAGVGDTVEIIPCRRISKNKSWRLLRVIRSSEMPENK